MIDLRLTRRRRGGRAPLVPLALLATLGLAACGDATGPGGGPAGCDGTVRLAPGEVVPATAPAELCLEGAAGAEYVLVSFLDSEGSPNLRRRVILGGEGHVSVQPAAAPPAARASGRVAPAGAGADPGPDVFRSPQDVLTGWHTAHGRLRAREREELHGRFHRARAAREEGTALPSVAASLAAAPAVGAEVELDVSPSCAAPDVRRGRVVAVTDRAVVVHDLANPAPRLDEAELEGFGRSFDERVYPLVTSTWGPPTDLDGNGRVILFFTRGVNDQGLGGSSIVAGFFWSGDLFPRAECGSSNGAEILYLMVPDGSGAGGAIIEEELVRRLTVATMAHELQHLVNAGTRIHRLDAEEFEETWLNEGLSLVAEELLFYETTGLGPRLELGGELAGDPALSEAFDRYQLGNVGRYDIFLRAPGSFSPMGADALATRGATWSFLRYALDRDPAADAGTLGSLVSTPRTGLENLGDALGVRPVDWMGEWAVSVLLDDLADGGEARWAQPSWNLRDLIPVLRAAQGQAEVAFPLRLLPWAEGTRLGFDLIPGSAAYPRFGVPAGTTARITVEAEELRDGEAVRLWLTRIR